MSSSAERKRELARQRARRYRLRLGPRQRPDLARCVVRAEVNAALIDDATALLHAREPGRWPRLRRPAGYELSLSDLRAQRDAMATALLDRVLREIVTRDAGASVGRAIVAASSRAVRPIMHGDDNEDGKTSDSSSERSAAD